MVPKNICVIEFDIPAELAVALGIADGDRLPIGEHSGMAFPDIDNGSGFERILIGPERIEEFNRAFSEGRIQHRRLRFGR